MTVQELVDKLTLFPPEMEVWLEYGMEAPSWPLGDVTVRIRAYSGAWEPRPTEKSVILAP